MSVDIKIENNKIWFNVKDSKSREYIGFTDYSDELFKLLSTVPWHVRKSNYLYSTKYKKYLHRIVMEYWYGEDYCKKMYQNGFVIDHLDNNGLNCQYENLEFLKEVKNLHLKGNVFDKRKQEQIPIAAVSIYKQKSGEYQITIAFNTPFNNTEGQGISRACLVYRERDYDLVLIDALLIQDFIENGRIELKDLHHQAYSWQPSFRIVSNLPLQPGNIINGYIVQGDGVQVIKAAPDKQI